MRLIDADALVESIKEELWHWDTVDGINAITVLKQTISDINNMPTIPQPEIIRCRDCKNWIDNDGFNHEHGAQCELINMWMQPGDYCSYGRRKVSK